MKKRQMLVSVTFALAALAAGSALAEKARLTDAQMIERGRYVAQIAGCNDCHTAGYAPSGGKVPQKDWLMGDALGWKGDWGTTYPANLRLTLAKMTENQWVEYARKLESRPPMPWFALHDMTEQDLRAFHRFVRSLGPAGVPAPDYVAPGITPAGPFVQFPSAPPKAAANASATGK